MNTRLSQERKPPHLIVDNDAEPDQRRDVATIVGSLPVEIPEGEYEVVLHHYDTALWYRPKVVFTFVITSGDYAGTELPCWYGALSIEAHKKRSGTFEVGPRSRLVADHARLFFRPENGLLDLDLWWEARFRATVETVHPKSAVTYSVIRRLEHAK